MQEGWDVPKLTNYHETIGGCGNPNINTFYKGTSGSYHNTTRTATIKPQDGSKMVARYHTTY